MRKSSKSDGLGRETSEAYPAKGNDAVAPDPDSVFPVA